jgi:cysteinyl-tRNA synthetase
MSKSLGNFLTIDDMLKNYDSNTLRLFILTNHYRMPVEFSDEALTYAQAGVKRLINAKQTQINEELDITQTPEYKEFCEAMDEDLNTSKALAVLFDLTTRANKDEKNAYTILYKLGTVLGFTFEKAGLSDDDIKKAIDAVSDSLGKEFSSMDEILEIRKQARAEKNWDIADKIRVSLDSAGIVLKDTPEGTKVELK